MTLGLLDWGLGGLFALAHARRSEPTLDVVYLADSGNTPYGKQSREHLAQSVLTSLHRLADLGATEVLIACHSGSSALPDITPPVPTRGVIDAGCVPADARRVAVLAGARTVRSGRWRRALQAHGVASTGIVQRVAQPLSAHVEAGRIDHREMHTDLDRILAPVLDADVVVLACTHYAALEHAIRERMPNARVVDPALAVVGSMRMCPGSTRTIAVTTGDVARSRTVSGLLLEVPLQFEASKS